jgi:ketosteroid isomerase-like protein
MEREEPRESVRSESGRDRREEVQRFLDRMGRAVTSGDGRTVAGMWEVPALVLEDERVMAIQSSQEIKQFFGGAKEQYNARGITDTRAEIVRLDWATAKIAMVEVRWPYLDAKGSVHGEERSTYTLRRDEAGTLKLRVAVMHGASERRAAQDPREKNDRSAAA